MLCLVCGGDELVERMNVGAHPVATFFATRADAEETRYSLGVGQCSRCGTIQLMRPVPHDALVPPYDWLFAREPEGHLDEVVENILALPGITADSVVGALTSKDDTTVERLIRKGLTRTWRVRLDEDLGVENKAANIETVQKLTTPERMADVVARRGLADILLVRHIIEHVEDLPNFVRGLSRLVRPGGYIMVEAPDCTRNLDLADYTMIWEEHSLYLTPATFAPLLSIGGFETVRSDVYPIPYENSMVVLARKTGEPGDIKVTAAAAAQMGMLDRYAERFEKTKRDVRALLTDIRRDKGGIALFGAGHLACAFVNYLEVGDLIDFVADDTPQKQNKFLPGSLLPIVPSARLAEERIALCLLALSINNEDKVIERNGTFTAGGGEFRSIFRASPRSVFRDMG